MVDKKVLFEDIYDLFALRIILNNIPPEEEKSACWRVYSLITDVYQPNPDRLRDWITSPRENGYESLHTTVMGNDGRWVEVQIRTTRMDEIAERGLAAHWKYKGDSFEDGQLDIWLKRLKQTLHDPEKDAQEFLDDFKLNLYASEIFVFTPKGDLKRMPIGSTVLDYAFEIHSELGFHSVGGKINRNKTVPLDYKLQSGDQIEIITSDKQVPQQHWIDFVVTAKAKNSLKLRFKSEKRRNQKRGQAIVEIMIKELGYDPEEHVLRKLLEGYGCNTKQELYLLAVEKGINADEFKNFITKKRSNKIINYWMLKIEKVISRSVGLITDSNTNTEEPQEPEHDIVEEITITDDKKYIIASCCNPIPGDQIIGIQRGLMLYIHKDNCVRVSEMINNPDVSTVKINWVKQQDQAFLARIKLLGYDRLGLLNDIIQLISKELQINIRTMHFDTTEKHFEGFLDLYILDVQHLNSLMAKIGQVNGVKTVQRVEKID